MATEDKIERVLLEKLGNSGVRFFAGLLDRSRLTYQPEWIQGIDHLGRGIVLIGDEVLGEGPEAQELVALILQDLAAGGCPDMVCPIAFAPLASFGIVAAVDGPADEIMFHAERGTGKTVVEATITKILA